jgi:hypothetical protein
LIPVTTTEADETPINNDRIYILNTLIYVPVALIILALIGFTLEINNRYQRRRGTTQI